MSVSAVMLGSQLVSAPVTLRNPSLTASFGLTQTAAPLFVGGGPNVIECSSRPQKKATAHHRKTRPRKTQPWDIKRKPTVYAPLPPLPPDWTLVAATDEIPSSTQVPPTTQ